MSKQAPEKKRSTRIVQVYRKDGTPDGFMVHPEDRGARQLRQPKRKRKNGRL